MTLTLMVIATAAFYLLHILATKFFTLQVKDMAKADRASRALWNFKESLPIFLVFAMLSIQFDTQQNIMLSGVWLLCRLAYVVVYIFGWTAHPAAENGEIRQWLRSLLWFASVICLIWMAVNLLAVS